MPQCFLTLCEKEAFLSFDALHTKQWVHTVQFDYGTIRALLKMFMEKRRL